jgi:rod shape-determining protein MreB
MTTTETATLEKKETPQKQPAPQKKGQQLLVGLDLGTNTSFILSGQVDSNDYTLSKLMPSVVGYVREGLVNGILPTQDEVFYGDNAIENKLHLDLVWPLRDGVIYDAKATRDLLKHLRKQVDPAGNAEIRAVVGMPANTSAQTK